MICFRKKDSENLIDTPQDPVIDSDEPVFVDEDAFETVRIENRAKLIKLGAMLVLSIAVFIFDSIAWFTMDREKLVVTIRIPYNVATA